MNINTISHPALSLPASPLPTGAAAQARNAQPHQPFAALLQQAHQASHSIASQLSGTARTLSALSAMNHAP